METKIYSLNIEVTRADCMSEVITELCLVLQCTKDTALMLFEESTDFMRESGWLHVQVQDQQKNGSASLPERIAALYALKGDITVCCFADVKEEVIPDFIL